MSNLILEVVTVPDDLAHKSRAQELRELSAYVSVKANGITGAFQTADGQLATFVNGLLTSLASSGSSGIPFMPSQSITISIAAGSFTFNCSATNTPTSWLAMNLPNGLSINASSGVITGTPTNQGTYNCTILPTNANGSGQATLTITVTA